MKRDNGFTLIELLLSLSIITILLLLVVPFSLSALQNAEEKAFFRTIESDVLFIQSMAHEDILYSIRFADDHYKIVRGSQGGIIRRSYPTGLEVQTHSNNTITFNRYGSVKNPRTIYIHTRHDTYLMVFPFGKGRYYIEKE
ncbi:competence type IV pilus minor pilin ComGD [Virgibacillus kimchii]